MGLYALVIVLGWVVSFRLCNAQEAAACIPAWQDYRVALQSYEDGLLDPAIAGFKDYLRKCPEGDQVPQAHYFLAETFYKQQRFTEALDHATQVISLPMSTALHPHALLLAAQCARQLGQIESAVAYLQRVQTATESAEVLSIALYWLGELASQQQRYEDARMYYQRTVEAQPTGESAVHAQYALGWIYRQLGNASAALEAFSAFLTQVPKHEFAPQARFAQAALFRETGQLAEAKAAFEELAQEAPADLLDEALFWWAELAYQLEQYPDASAVYQRLVSALPQSTRAEASLYGWGWAEVQQRHCDAALQPWETLLKKAPQFPQAIEVHYHLGVCYVQLDLTELARSHLLQVMGSQLNPAQRHDATLKLAALAFQDSAYPEAIRYYTMALASSKDEGRVRLHYLLGESYAAMGTLTPAMEQWQQALADVSDQPLRAQLLLRIGRTYVDQQAWSQAIPVLQQLWDGFPAFSDRLVVATYLVQAYRESGQCTDALPFYNAIISAATESQKHQAAINAKAVCLFESDRHAEVVQFLSPLLAPDTNEFVEPQLLYLLGQAYLHLQQDDEALTPLFLLRQRFPMHPLTATAESLLAKILERLGLGREALTIWQAFLQRAVDQDTDEIAALRLYVGRLALKEGELSDVLDILAPVRGATSPPLAAEALFWSGEVYLQQQQWELALQVYQELIDTYTEEHRWRTLARFKMAVTYEHQQDWERALRVYQTLLSATMEEEVRANVQQRIVAIEAGRVFKPQQPPRSPSEG
ncbi:MAG: tetratricopeptide repeat protein [Candidatus Tectomicrobia bacterium]